MERELTKYRFVCQTVIYHEKADGQEEHERFSAVYVRRVYSLVLPAASLYPLN